MSDATDPLDGMQRAFDRLKAHAAHLASRVERLEGELARSEREKDELARAARHHREENTRLRVVVDAAAAVIAACDAVDAARLAATRAQPGAANRVTVLRRACDRHGETLVALEEALLAAYASRSGEGA